MAVLTKAGMGMPIACEAFCRAEAARATIRLGSNTRVFFGFGHKKKKKK